MVKAGFIIKNDAQVIQAKIVKELKPQILKMFNDATPKIQEFIKFHIRDAIENSFEFKSMVGGELAAELGFEDGQKQVNAVIRELLKEIVVKVDSSKFDRSGISVNYLIQFVDLDFKNIIGMPEAEYVSTNSKGESHNVEWADWLLFAGNSFVVKHFFIDYTLTPEERARSRSGLALMKPSRSQNYRIPPGFSGTHLDNIVTRAFDQSEKIIEKEVEKIIQALAK